MYVSIFHIELVNKVSNEKWKKMIAFQDIECLYKTNIRNANDSIITPRNCLYNYMFSIKLVIYINGTNARYSQVC